MVDIHIIWLLFMLFASVSNTCDFYLDGQNNVCSDE